MCLANLLAIGSALFTFDIQILPRFVKHVVVSRRIAYLIKSDVIRLRPIPGDTRSSELWKPRPWSL